MPFIRPNTNRTHGARRHNIWNSCFSQSAKGFVHLSSNGTSRKRPKDDLCEDWQTHSVVPTKLPKQAHYELLPANAHNGATREEFKQHANSVTPCLLQGAILLYDRSPPVLHESSVPSLSGPKNIPEPSNASRKMTKQSDIHANPVSVSENLSFSNDWTISVRDQKTKPSQHAHCLVAERDPQSSERRSVLRASTQQSSELSCPCKTFTSEGGIQSKHSHPHTEFSDVRGHRTESPSCGSKDETSKSAKATDNCDLLELFGCKYCYLKFSTELNLKRHLFEAHQSGKGFTCENCEVFFENCGSLLMHKNLCTRSKL